MTAKPIGYSFRGIICNLSCVQGCPLGGLNVIVLLPYQ
jgi:hypothetical protein